MRRKRKMTLTKINTKQAYEEFIQEKTARNLSEETLATYSIHIKNYLDNENLWDVPTDCLTKSTYEQWISKLKSDNRKKDVTITSYCRSVRNFLYWLQDNEYTEACDLQLPKYQKTTKECYTDNELKRLLKNPLPCSEVNYQTWVFINLICATGMRLKSALNIRVSDIEVDEHAIYIQTTKNKHAQIFFIGNEMISILTKYIRLFHLDDNDYLFCTADKNRPAKRTIQENVAKYNLSCGVKKTSIHLFRHTFAKNYYSQTKDMYTLSHILGHSSIATTENYLRDLGINPADTTAYNPQVIYGTKSRPKKRRSKINLQN